MLLSSLALLSPTGGEFQDSHWSDSHRHIQNLKTCDIKQRLDWADEVVTETKLFYLLLTWHFKHNSSCIGRSQLLMMLNATWPTKPSWDQLCLSFSQFPPTHTLHVFHRWRNMKQDVIKWEHSTRSWSRAARNAVIYFWHLFGIWFCQSPNVYVCVSISDRPDVEDEKCMKKQSNKLIWFLFFQ